MVYESDRVSKQKTTSKVNMQNKCKIVRDRGLTMCYYGYLLWIIIMALFRCHCETKNKKSDLLGYFCRCLDSRWHINITTTRWAIPKCWMCPRGLYLLKSRQRTYRRKRWSESLASSVDLLLYDGYWLYKTLWMTILMESMLGLF